MADKIKVEVAAQTDGLSTGMNQAAGTVENFSNRVRNQFGPLGGVFDMLKGKFLELGAVIGTGELFKKAIETTTQMTEESGQLASTLGITMTQADALRVAIENANASQVGFHVSTQTLIMAQQRVAMTLRTNETAFTQLGVNVHTSNGHYKNALEIMNEVNDKLRAMGNTTAQSVMGIQVYGRAWMQMKGILSVNKETIAAAANEVNELNLRSDPKDVIAYHQALTHVTDVMKGMLNTIGQALLPILTEVGNWFKTYGPQAIEATRIAIASVTSVIDGLINGFKILYQIVKAAFTSIADDLAGFAAAMKQVLHGNFSGAMTTLKTAAGDAEAAWSNAFKNIIASSDKAHAAIVHAFSKALDPKKVAAIKGGLAGMGAGDGGNFMSLKDQQAGDYAAQGLLQAKQFSVAYWDERRKADEANGKITLQQSQQIAEQEEKVSYAAQVEYYARKRALAQGDVAKIAQINAQLEKVEETHTLKMLKIHEDYEAKIAKQQEKTQKAMIKSYEGIFSAATTAIDRSVQGIIQGTQTMQQAVSKIGQSVLQQFVSNESKQLAHYLATEMAKTQAAQAGATARKTISQEAALETIMQQAWTSIKEITASAWSAAAKAYDAMAGIPEVGPAEGAAAAATTSAAVLGFASNVPSFAVGSWSLPSDMLAQVHKGEMIIPADAADSIRNGAGAPTVHVHYAPNVQAIDKRGMSDLFDQHRDALVAAIQKQTRSFR